MGEHRRQIHREHVDLRVSLYWEDLPGRARSASLRMNDLSAAGVQVEGGERIESGQQVYLDVSRFGFPLEAAVRYCIPSRSGFRMGMEFSESTRRSVAAAQPRLDYYEILQLSPNADPETIHRVYRIMATRLHPDNPESGDPDKFLLLSEAYAVLSDAEKRSQYDAIRGSARPGPLPLFQARAFIDEKEGEGNRRLGVLCLLYAQRRRSPDRPSITLLELEELMSFPREYLEFTLWYLKEKKYIASDQSADFVLTAAGVDFVEENTPAQAVLRKLLESGHAMNPQEESGAVALRG